MCGTSYTEAGESGNLQRMHDMFDAVHTHGFNPGHKPSLHLVNIIALNAPSHPSDCFYVKIWLSKGISPSELVYDQKSQFSSLEELRLC